MCALGGVPNGGRQAGVAPEYVVTPPVCSGWAGLFFVEAGHGSHFAGWAFVGEFAVVDHGLDAGGKAVEVDKAGGVAVVVGAFAKACEVFEVERVG